MTNEATPETLTLKELLAKGETTSWALESTVVEFLTKYYEKVGNAPPETIDGLLSKEVKKLTDDQLILLYTALDRFHSAIFYIAGIVEAEGVERGSPQTSLTVIDALNSFKAAIPEMFNDSGS